MRPLYVLALAGTVSLVASQVVAGPCTQRIAAIEKSVTAQQEGAGPAATGSVQGATAANDQPGSTAAKTTAENSRLPANRPATPETSAAKAENSAAGQSAGTGQEEKNRLPANRSESPAGQAARMQSQPSTSAAVTPQGASSILQGLQQAKLMDQQGREADCMDALSKLGPIPSIK